MSILSDLKGLLFPPVCPVCGGELQEGCRLVCTLCRITVPMTRYWQQPANPMAERVRRHVPVDAAHAFIFLARGSGWHRMIHAFKYRSAWRTAYRMGRWYGEELLQSGAAACTDLVVPMPLHWLRRLKRGYNQSEYLARGIASALGAEVETHAVVRSRNNPSQTRSGTERWSNVQGIFRVRRPEAFEGRRILLVDDVFTTGATMISCAETILRAAPGCRIGMAALAVSRRGLELPD